MKNSLLRRQLMDREYQRRVNRQDLGLLLMLLPLLVFAASAYVEIGFVPPVALIFAAATYACVLLLCTWRGRRGVLEDLRREGQIGMDYEPPTD